MINATFFVKESETIKIKDKHNFSFNNFNKNVILNYTKTKFGIDCFCQLICYKNEDNKYFLLTESDLIYYYRKELFIQLKSDKKCFCKLPRDELIRKVNEYYNIINENETREKFLIEKEENFYDVIIDIDSINYLKGRGWEIKKSKESQEKEIYEKIIKEETIKIGVLGLNNVGKSFILGKIAGVEIPTGYSIETKGISIKYKTSDHICLLDSAGFETPLLKYELDMYQNDNKTNEINNCENKKINEKLRESVRNKANDNISIIQNKLKKREKEIEIARDKTQTERFIEQLIISLSDMLILVIGKLTRTEQKLITRIKNIVENKETIKNIIIIHNLAQYNRKIEVENHINKILLQSATFSLIEQKVIGIPKYEDRTFYIEEGNSPNIKVYHYLMAKQGTEAGKFYNELTIQLIKQNYNQCN